jgi:hypothetical protein
MLYLQTKLSTPLITTTKKGKRLVTQSESHVLFREDKSLLGSAIFQVEKVSDI